MTPAPNCGHGVWRVSREAILGVCAMLSAGPLKRGVFSCKEKDWEGGVKLG